VLTERRNGESGLVRWKPRLPRRGEGARKGTRIAIVTGEVMALAASAAVVTVVLRQGHPATSADSAPHQLVEVRSQTAQPFPTYSVPPSPHPAEPPTFPAGGSKSKSNHGQKPGQPAGTGSAASAASPSRPAPTARPSVPAPAGSRQAGPERPAPGPSPVASSAPAENPSSSTPTADANVPKSPATSPPPSLSAGQIEVSGQVSCQSGQAITGFWVQTQDSADSGWASWRQVSGGPNADYWYFMPGGQSYKLSVGCGGSAQSWAVTTYTSSVTGTHNSFDCDDVKGTTGYGACVLR
jgi:hypothetical protein